MAPTFAGKSTATPFAARKKWSGLPPAVRRLARWWLFPVAVIALGVTWLQFAGGFSVIGVAGRGGSWTGVLIPLFFFAPMFFSIGVVGLSMRRMKRAYDASEGRLCTDCTHELRGLGDAGTCPECGHAFDIERDRRAWKQAGVR